MRVVPLFYPKPYPWYYNIPGVGYAVLGMMVMLTLLKMMGLLPEFIGQPFVSLMLFLATEVLG